MKITRTLLAVVLFLLPSLKTEAKDMNNKKDIKVVAHRGYWNCEEAGFARNSLAALECALKEGF
jgi:glycerophosphoryl diester phosphodiesterase